MCGSPFPLPFSPTLTFPIKYSIGKTFRKCWVNKGRDFFLKASIEFLRVFNVLMGTAFLQEWNVVCSASWTWPNTFPWWGYTLMMFLKYSWRSSVWKHSCRLILTPQFHWKEEARLLLLFSFGLLPKWLSSFNVQLIHFYQSPVLRLCYSLPSPGAHDTPGFLLKHQIWSFPPHPSFVVNLRDLNLWINIFDPFFLAPQPPLTLPVFCLSLFSNTKNHLFSELPSCHYLPVIRVPCTSLSPLPPVNWNLALSRMAHSLLPCLFFSVCLTLLPESLFYYIQYELRVCDPPPPARVSFCQFFFFFLIVSLEYSLHNV